MLFKLYALHAHTIIILFIAIIIYYYYDRLLTHSEDYIIIYLIRVSAFNILIHVVSSNNYYAQ